MMFKAVLLSVSLAVPAFAAHAAADMSHHPAPPAASRPAGDMKANCSMIKDGMAHGPLHHHDMMKGSKGVMAADDRHAMTAGCQHGVRFGHAKKHRHR